MNEQINTQSSFLGDYSLMKDDQITLKNLYDHIAVIHRERLDGRWGVAPSRGLT